MLRPSTFAGLFVSVLPLFALAEDDRDHPLESKVAALIDSATSTADTVEAYNRALKLWDAELNRCYSELKKGLNPAGFSALQLAQRQWLAYRDQQLKFIAELYVHFDGTMYIPMRAAAAMEVTRKRALELHHDLQLLKEQGG